jgi:hypothetical protein
MNASNWSLLQDKIVVTFKSQFGICWRKRLSTIKTMETDARKRKLCFLCPQLEWLMYTSRDRESNVVGKKTENVYFMFPVFVTFRQETAAGERSNQWSG